MYTQKIYFLGVTKKQVFFYQVADIFWKLSKEIVGTFLPVLYTYLYIITVVYSGEPNNMSWTRQASWDSDFALPITFARTG